MSNMVCGQATFQSYIICTTPRSGSTLLCRMLAETGVAGQPESHFHTPSLERWLEIYGLSETDFDTRHEALRAIFDHARSRGSSSNGLFGLRMQRASFEHFIAQVATLFPQASNDFERIQAAFGPTLFVHLFRSDKLSQAISRYKAEQTGVWHRNSDGSELERLPPKGPAIYDASEIGKHLRELTALDAAWEDWFRAQQIRPMRIKYEDLSGNPQKVVTKLLSALAIDPSRASGITAPTAKLADKTNADWAARYRSEFG